MNTSIAELIWNQLQGELQQVRDMTDVTATRTERSETAGGVRACLYAELPLAADGASAGDLYFCTNACKDGEAAGTGTGTIVYYNSTTDTWYRVADDTAVVI